MERDILRPVNAKHLKDCWQCRDEAEARRLADWLAVFKIETNVVTLGQCKDLEGRETY